MRLDVTFNERNEPLKTDFKPDANKRFQAGYTEKIEMSMEKVPIATEERLGGVIVGENLKITKEGVLSVDTARKVEQDNTKPITSGAVFMEVGNIEALLKNI